MSKYTTAKAREEFSEVLNRAAYGKERIVLTRRGKDLVGVVPIEDIHILEGLENQIDLEEARAAIRETKKLGTVPWERVKQELKFK